jgi:hypothetical protein
LSRGAVMCVKCGGVGVRAVLVFCVVSVLRPGVP